MSRYPLPRFTMEVDEIVGVVEVFDGPDHVCSYSWDPEEADPRDRRMCLDKARFIVASAKMYETLEKVAAWLADREGQLHEGENALLLDIDQALSEAEGHV